MKALSLWQPWASLIAMGEKTIETRSWETNYRGPLAIHATAKLPPKWLGASRHELGFRNELADVLNVRRDCDERMGKHVNDALRTLPYGAIICVVDLLEIAETACMQRDELPMREQIFGNYEDGRYAWHLRLLQVFKEPIPAKGHQGLWNWQHPDKKLIANWEKGKYPLL